MITVWPKTAVLLIHEQRSTDKMVCDVSLHLQSGIIWAIGDTCFLTWLFHLFFLFKAIALRTAQTGGSISVGSDSPPGTKTRTAAQTITVPSAGTVPGGSTTVSTVTSMGDTYLEGRPRDGRASSGTPGWVRRIPWSERKWRSDPITKFRVWSLHSASQYRTSALLT